MRLSKGSFIFITFSSQSIYYLLSFAMGIIIARSLGPEGKGVYYLSFLAGSMLFSLVKFSLEIATVYFINTKKYSKSDIFPNIIFMGLLVGSLVVVILIILFPPAKNKKQKAGRKA